MPERILVIEDEVRIADQLSDYLRADGFDPHCIDHGDRALAWLDTHPLPPSLVVLDLVLPGVDGLALCRALRKMWPDLPIIMLTSRVEEIDRLPGLEPGADAYICKPFSRREVITRVHALLRRPQAPVSRQEGER